MMPACAKLTVTICLGVLGLALSSGRAQAEEDPFELRAFDEVIFKDGAIVRGIIIETDTKGTLKIKDVRSNTVRPFAESETQKIKRKQTPEMALERLSKEHAGDSIRILSIARQAMRRFNNVTPKIMAMLEKEARSNNPDLLAFLCELYLQSGQNNPALKTAEALVSAATTRASSYMLRGLAQLALNNVKGAEADLDKAFKMAPDDEQVLVARANFLLADGRAADAKAMFTSALGKNQKNIAALAGQGLVQMRQGEFTEAEQSFQQALQVNAEHRQARIGLASAKLMNKEYDEAFREADSVLRADPKCAEAYAVQALSKLFQGDKDSLLKFEKLVKESLAERPNQPRLTLAWAAAIERMAKFEEAPNTKEALAAAKALRDSAETKYKELAAADVPDAYIQYFIGEKKFRGGDFSGAQACFQRTLSMSPRYAPAHAALGATALKLGKWDAAKAAYSDAMRHDSSVGEYHAGLGLALLKVQRFDEASESFKRARELDKRNVTALCGLGYVANFSKNKASALEFFQQALAVDGRNGYAADALKKIYAQENVGLEYLTFDDNAIPGTWKARSAGPVKVAVVNGQLLFSGTQGAATGNRVEFCKDIKADEFARVEADLEMAPSSAVNCGLRVASGVGAGVSFEIEFGKDESNEIKVRYKDYGGALPAWQSLKVEWPSEGRVRLAMDSDDLKAGRIRLWMNGRKCAEVNLKLQKPARVTAGVFVMAPPKEAVRVTSDNLVLLVRGAVTAADKEAQDALTIIKDEEKKGEQGGDKDKEAKDKAPK